MYELCKSYYDWFFDKITFENSNDRYRRYGKRMLDILLSSLILLPLLPIFTLVAIMVYFKLGHPIFFGQERPGYKGEPFMMYKFRTMTDECDADGNLLPDHLRLPRFGELLRSTSLDELPEIFLVFKGDMSLVGPRPLLMRYLDRYTATQMRRHDARPGITGLAQINGRNNLDWERKFRLDVQYVDEHSLALDLKILFLTIQKILLREDVNKEGFATTVEFFGTQSKEEG